MRSLPKFRSLVMVCVAISGLLIVRTDAVRAQAPGMPGRAPQSRYMPPPVPPTYSLGLQTRVTDTGVLVVGHTANSVGRAAGIERGDLIITVDGQQVGQVGNRLSDLDQTLQNTMNRQGSVLLLIRNGRDGGLLNVGIRRDQFVTAPPIIPPPVPPGPVKPPPVPPGPVTPPGGGAMQGQIVQLKKWYLQYLGRDATPQEVAGWETQLRQGRQVDAIRNELLAGTEYYRRNGSDEAKFIGALFRDLLRRNPVSPEGGNWLTRLKQLKADRLRFVEAFRSHYKV